MTDIREIVDPVPLETAEANGHRAVREPLVYQLAGERSYFADRYRASKGDSEASELLAKHTRQMDAIPKGETRTVPGTNLEYRVQPNLESGHGLEFTVPLWLNEYFATAARPGECIQRLTREKGNEYVMPQGASSIALPRLTKGTLVNDQTPNAPTDDQDIETKEVKAQAIVYSGEADTSIQLLEQSPQGPHLDLVLFKDMGESLDAELETDLITGKGETFNEALGLLNIAGINKIENTEVKTETMYTALAEAKAAVAVERKRAIDAWLMPSGRLAFLAMAVEKEQRPMILTDNVGEDWPVASLAGTAVYYDEAIPRTVNTNQEPILAVRADDFILWHSPVRTAVMEEPLAGTLGVRFLLYRTTASMLHRYPTGIASITGAGMKASGKYYS